ncbi:p53 negative regulator [Parasponia andersonii]|uniref:p53 negative regulator n=1 Tax=Parasponia andersonii TaxID=3476 RepID=A0A2P5AQG3_PARAD|nr:p53 negative regulator [Parasponia andersonii]
MITDQEISQALQNLIQESSSVNSRPTTLNGVVSQLESKLGHDLSHKAEFIRSQIQLIFRSHPTVPPHHHQQQPQSQPQPAPPQLNDRFAPHQNPNFHPTPSAFQTFSLQPHQPQPPQPKHEVAASAEESVSATDRPKEGTQTKAKRKGGPGGLNKLCGVSPELQAIVGQPALPRTEIVKQLWAYIRRNNLQDPSNKRKIICNDELRLVFETDCTDMFKMNKLLAKHIIPLEPTKQTVPKKPKVDVESATKSTEANLSVIISETLANFFGVSGREMLQSEVSRRIWEYIKVNNLEDPLNPMAILCDAKLQELFGCESISALGISEVYRCRSVVWLVDRVAVVIYIMYELMANICNWCHGTRVPDLLTWELG